MKIIKQKFTILKIQRPMQSNINEDLQWLGSSLGLFSLRDKDKSCFRIFIELIKSSKHKEPLSSDELAEKLKLSRGTIIFHINKLTSTGLVVTKNSKYMLKVDDLEDLIDEMESDIKRTIHNLKDVAKKIDKQLG